MATLALEEQDIDAELLAAQEEEQRKREEARAALSAQLAAQAESESAPASGLLPNYSAPQPAPDKYAALQSFFNTLNPNTASQGRQELAIQGLDTQDPFENAPRAQPGPNADTQARRLFGRDEFQRLVSAGVPPADAYARVAPDLLSGDTAAISRVISPSRRTAPVPPSGTASVRINRDPETGEVFSRSILNPSGTVQSTTRVAPPAMPADRKAGQESLKREIDAAYKQLNADTALARKPGEDPDAVTAATKRAVNTQGQIRDMERKLQEGSTNWQSKASAPAVPADSSSGAKSKAEQANELARKNPGWTRQQIIEAVNRGR